MDLPVAPADALRRVAYLLERQRAESYKVRAFRRAASTIDATDRDRLEELARRGRLTDLPGVGATTARVIAEALEGRVPSYLAELESDAAGESEAAALGEGAAALRRSLRGDCHSHSDWSDGGSPIEEMASAARALGHDYWALTDHSPRRRRRRRPRRSVAGERRRPPLSLGTKPGRPVTPSPPDCPAGTVAASSSSRRAR